MPGGCSLDTSETPPASPGAAPGRPAGRPRRAASADWRKEVLYRLEAPGCLVCREQAAHLRRFYFWFLEEQYGTIECILDMQRSYGFCPRHTRHLLAFRAASQTATVHGYVLGAAARALRTAEATLRRGGHKTDERACREAAAILRPRGECKACVDEAWSADHSLFVLLSTLHDENVRRTYRRASGLCLRHFLRVAKRARWDDLEFLATAMREVLQARWNGDQAFGASGVEGHEQFPAGVPHALVTRIAGEDLDASTRRRPDAYPPMPSAEPGKQSAAAQERVADGAAVARRSGIWQWSPTQAEMLALLEEPGCPVCALCARGLEEYLRWLIQEVGGDGRRAGWDLAWELCPAHLWDLASYGDADASGTICGAMAVRWAGKLAGLLANLLDRPPERLMNRLARLPEDCRRRCETARERREGGRPIFRLREALVAALEPPQRTLARRRAATFLPERCAACDHMTTTTKRGVELTLRLLQNPEVLRLYHRSQGLCLRHCRSVAERAERPEVLGEILRAQAARLDVLGWELEEFGRKQSWSVRFESKRGEATSWLRAACQIAGSAVRHPHLLGT